MFRTTWLCACLLFSSWAVRSQSRFPATDKSPLDISYFPPNYPILKIQNKTTEAPLARIIYSRPQKSGRTIFGDLVEYGKIWRLGANEATEIELFKDVRISEKKIKKGRYTLYAIPSPESWTLILNKELDTWGAFQYDLNKDVIRVNITPEINPDIQETFTLVFEGSKENAFLVIAWDNYIAKLSLSW
jgi:hypothetical protein